VPYYDRADWHYGGNYPPDLAPENGGTHIGFFLAWAIHRGLQGEFHDAESAAALEAVRQRRMTGREFLFQECDEKFGEEQLNAEGNEFAQSYYAPDSGYMADYHAALGKGLPSLYHVADTWANFDRLAPVVDRRYQTWKTMGTRRWFQFRRR
jgi:hypothetical protein